MLAPLTRPEQQDPALRRAQATELSGLAHAALGRGEIAVATEDYVVAVDGHPDARARVYWPTPGGRADARDLPVFVYFFGGGFTLGGIDDVGWDHTARRRASEAGVIIVAGEYSLAPEVRFPAQPEQCWAILDWAARAAESLGGDHARLGVGGASSGGNLAASAALLDLERSRHPLRLLLLENPALDLTMRSVETRGMRTGVPDAILRRLGGRLVRDYLGPGRALRRDPRASPMHSSALGGLPETVVYTAEFDPLRGDGEAFVHRLLAAGVAATGVRYLGQTHTSGGLVDWVPAATHHHRDVVTTLRGLHAAPFSRGLRDVEA